MKKISYFMMIPWILIIMSSCTPGDEAIKGRGETQAAYTMVAVLTQSGYETVAAKLTEVSALVTPQPSNTGTPNSVTTPDLSQTAPAVTPKAPAAITPLATSATFVPAAGTPCNRVQYIKDVTVPDGTGFNANQQFTKTWRVKNVGSCTWTNGYKVIYSGGADIGSAREIPLSINVPPGNEVDISVNMTSPNLAGTYNSYWQFQSADNQVFGIGPTAKDVLYVQIKVGSGYSHANTAYYMGPAACSAGWFSNKGAISCPSTLDAVNGGVVELSTIVVESGGKRDLPAIVILPPDGKDGRISGQFPSYQVQPGDHFKAQIGCVDGFPKCNVLFQLSYVGEDKVAHSLGSWGQTEDAYIDQLDFDLSAQAGTTIQMIFTVSNNDGSNEDDHAFWLNPIIQPNK
jgi:hypothetical protein